MSASQMPAESPEERRASDALRAINLFGDLPPQLQRAAVPVLVPMHRAVENECWFASNDAGEECFLKILCEDMRSFVDCAATLDASLKAAALQLAPAVKGYCLEAGAIAFERLGADWRTADMQSLQDSQTPFAVVAAKLRVHRSPAFAR